MSRIVDTELGRWRLVSNGTGEKNWLWECPKCKSWAGMNDAQMEGKVSVVCSGPGGHGGCDYHETHKFGALLVGSIQAMRLMGYRPYHDEGEDRWGNPIAGGVDGP